MAENVRILLNLLQNKDLTTRFSFSSVWLENQLDRDTKLIAILRRQYGFILTALNENIFRVGLRRHHQLMMRTSKETISNVL